MASRQVGALQPHFKHLAAQLVITMAMEVVCLSPGLGGPTAPWRMNQHWRGRGGGSDQLSSVEAAQKKEAGAEWTLHCFVCTPSPPS